MPGSRRAPKMPGRGRAGKAGVKPPIQSHAKQSRRAKAPRKDAGASRASSAFEAVSKGLFDGGSAPSGRAEKRKKQTTGQTGSAGFCSSAKTQSGGTSSASSNITDAMSDRRRSAVSVSAERRTPRNAAPSSRGSARSKNAADSSAPAVSSGRKGAQSAVSAGSALSAAPKSKGRGTRASRVLVPEGLGSAQASGSSRRRRAGGDTPRADRSRSPRGLKGGAAVVAGSRKGPAKVSPVREKKALKKSPKEAMKPMKRGGAAKKGSSAPNESASVSIWTPSPEVITEKGSAASAAVRKRTREPSAASSALGSGCPAALRKAKEGPAAKKRRGAGKSCEDMFPGGVSKSSAGRAQSPASARNCPGAQAAQAAEAAEAARGVAVRIGAKSCDKARVSPSVSKSKKKVVMKSAARAATGSGGSAVPSAAGSAVVSVASSAVDGSRDVAVSAEDGSPVVGERATGSRPRLKSLSSDATDSATATGGRAGGAASVPGGEGLTPVVLSDSTEEDSPSMIGGSALRAAAGRPDPVGGEVHMEGGAVHSFLPDEGAPEQPPLLTELGVYGPDGIVGKGREVWGQPVCPDPFWFGWPRCSDLFHLRHGPSGLASGLASGFPGSSGGAVVSAQGGTGESGGCGSSDDFAPPGKAGLAERQWSDDSLEDDGYASGDDFPLRDAAVDDEGRHALMFGDEGVQYEEGFEDEEGFDDDAWTDEECVDACLSDVEEADAVSKLGDAEPASFVGVAGVSSSSKSQKPSKRKSVDKKVATSAASKTEAFKTGAKEGCTGQKPVKNGGTGATASETDATCDETEGTEGTEGAKGASLAVSGVTSSAAHGETDEGAFGGDFGQDGFDDGFDDDLGPDGYGDDFGPDGYDDEPPEELDFCGGGGFGGLLGSGGFASLQAGSLHLGPGGREQPAPSAQAHRMTVRIRLQDNQIDDDGEVDAVLACAPPGTPVDVIPYDPFVAWARA